MARLEQALILDPSNELVFRGPFNEVRTVQLKLRNPTDKSIAFKVKTTAPKTYCVRPNGGYLQPNSSVNVSVMLQLFEPIIDDRNKDKFMVQSMYIPPNESYSDVLWHDVPSEALMNSKLKCVFIPTEDPAEVTLKVQAQKVSSPEVVDVPKPKVEITHVQEPKPSENEAENRRLQEEHKKLKLELASLRQENSVLKEEGIRYRMARPKDPTTGRPTEKPRAALANQQPAIPLNLLAAIACAVFVIGLIIGKVLL